MGIERAFEDCTVTGLAAVDERIEHRLAEMSDEAAAWLLAVSKGDDADDPS